MNVYIVRLQFSSTLPSYPGLLKFAPAAQTVPHLPIVAEINATIVIGKIKKPAALLRTRTNRTNNNILFYRGFRVRHPEKSALSLLYINLNINNKTALSLRLLPTRELHRVRQHTVKYVYCHSVPPKASKKLTKTD